MAIFLNSLFFLSLLFVSGSATPKQDFETNYLGDWKVDNPNAGVSSMNIQLLPNNKVIMYDATNLGPSSMKLPDGNCRPVPGRPGEVDCSAHAVEYDIETAKVRPLKVLSNTWCSSGGLTVDGNLISTGGSGTNEGNQSVRILNPCKGCDFKERLDVLAAARWSSSQEKLEDGNFILVGGSREFSYEYLQDSVVFTQKRVDLPFLRLTTTDKYENNLYPFVNLLPDGTIFLLANRRSIIIDTKTDKVVRELPVMPGGSRSFPASGMSALLPLKISNVNGSTMEAEVMVCGGAKPEAAEKAEKGELLWAMTDCGRLMVTNPNAQWELELMPTRRVMGDMLLLPTAEVLLLNGATQGVSGLSSADLANLTPLLYTPEKKVKHRFKSLTPTEIPRMYQSAAAVLPDGNVLVAGSNPNKKYDFQAKFPTELRVEKFIPPYLDHALDTHRPHISEDTSDKELAYGEQFTVKIDLEDAGVGAEDLKLTMLHPPFTTHGYSQIQRMLVLEPVSFVDGQITAVAPASRKLAPPGYYLLYGLHRGVPSRGMWVHIYPIEKTTN